MAHGFIDPRCGEVGSGGVSPPSDHPVADGAQFLNLTLHLVTALQGGGHGGSVPSGVHCVPTHSPAPPEPPFPLTLRKMGGFRKTPTPAGVPVSRMSPGTSVTNLGAHEVLAMAPWALGVPSQPPKWDCFLPGHPGNKGGHPKDEVAGVAVLHAVPVDAAADPQVVDICGR